MIRAIFTIILIGLVTLSFGQSRKKNAPQRFKAGLIVGGNLAQINGDLFSGYDKWGMQFGARGVMILTENLQASMELLYTQRGSKRPDKKKSLLGKEVDIDLTYAETPILINLLYKKNEELGFYRNHLHGGISFSRLLKTNVESGKTEAADVDYEVLAPFFETSDLSVIVGLTHYFTKHIGLTLRHSISIKKIYENNNEDTTGRITTDWHSFFFSAQAIYMF